MLPSRGLFRPSHSLGLRQTVLQASPCRTPSTGSSRQFGTSHRGHAALRTSSLPAFSISGSMKRSPIPRGSLSLSAMPLFSSAQTRFASTSPSETLQAPQPSSDLSDLAIDPTPIQTASDQIGYLHSLGLDFGWGPTSVMEFVLEHIHVYTGLPWWGSIALTCLAIRGVVFLPTLRAQENTQKMTELRNNPEWAEAAETMKKAMWDPSPEGRPRAMQARGAMMVIQRRAGVSMWKSWAPLIHIPFGIGMFRLLNGMTKLPVPGLDDGGLLWIKDLTVSDPLFILPLASSAIMIMVMRRAQTFTAPDQKRMMNILMAVLIPITTLVTLKMTAALQIFFLVSGLLQALQTEIFYLPFVRRWAGLRELKRGGAAAPGGPASGIIKTTAQVQSQGGIAASGFSALKGMKQNANEYMEKKAANERRAEAARYEQKRAQEEQEAFYRRQEDARLRELERKRRQQ